jgi:tetratricopeptide (TPR) repeat protein
MNKCAPKRFFGLLFALATLTLSCPLVIASDRIQQGIELFNKADYEAANLFLRKFKSELKDNPEFQFYYGLSLLKTDHAKEALVAVKRAVKLSPDNADYHFALSLIYMIRIGEVNIFRQTMMFSALKKSIVNGAEVYPTHIASNVYYAGWLLEAPAIGGGDVEKGLVQLEKVRRLSEADAVLLEAGFANKNEQFAEAEVLYLKAIQMETSPSSQIAIAQYYLEQKRYEKSILHANKFNSLPKLWLDRSNSEGHLILAMSYYHLGDTTAYEEHAEVAIDTSPNNVSRKRVKKTLADLE